MGRRSMTTKERKAASERMRQTWKTRRANATLTQHLDTPPPKVVVSNAHPTVEQRLIVRLQGTELTLNVGEARQLREALTEALPTL